jgi:hypothetical protein
VQGEDGLAVGAEEHKIGFPMAGLSAIGGTERPQSNGNAAFDVVNRTAAPTAAPTAFALAARQIEAPGIVFGAGNLGGDEAIDGLVADDDATVLTRQPAGDLLGRPAAAQTIEGQCLQFRIAQQLAAAPATGFRLRVGVTRLVADRRAAIALQLSSDARWRAIQSCRNLPDRLPGLAALGNLAPLFQAKVLI